MGCQTQYRRSMQGTDSVQVISEVSHLSVLWLNALPAVHKQTFRQVQLADI